jgi:hypothetical protein
MIWWLVGGILMGMVRREKIARVAAYVQALAQTKITGFLAGQCFHPGRNRGVTGHEFCFGFMEASS